MLEAALGALLANGTVGYRLITIFPFPPLFYPGHAATATDFLFGYQALAGIKYDISRGWDFKVGYKFLATAEGHDWTINGVNVKTDPTMSHSIFASLTYKF